ncbi:MAG: hypothetical protein DPW16_14980 [Chloroflexi bacterium]|nr:hypothetical protein [Chloroflexota bacterium]
MTKREINLQNKVRQAVRDGITYYSLVDIVRCYFDEDRPSQYWSDFRRRIIKHGKGEILAKIIRLKLPTGRDGKMYSTDCADFEISQEIIELLEGFKRKFLQRGNYSEVTEFCPYVGDILKTQGWTVQRHYLLPSDREIDILAKRENQALIVECKLTLLKSGEFQRALGQVLCYRVEYGLQSISAIAVPQGLVTDYARKYAKIFEVDIMEIVF